LLRRKLRSRKRLKKKPSMKDGKWGSTQKRTLKESGKKNRISESKGVYSVQKTKNDGFRENVRNY